MKKFLIVFLLALVPASLAFAETASIGIGASGSDVTNLQTILKADVSVYPEGIVTGYYGSLTANAVKRLQAKYGLPQTGVFDSNIRPIIFPINRILTVVSPNGGETWQAGTSQTVAWNVASTLPPPLPLMGVSAQGTGTVSPAARATTPATSPYSPDWYEGRPSYPIRYFYNTLIISLVRDSNPSFVRILGRAGIDELKANVFAPVNVPEGNDYRIKISSDFPCANRACPMLFPDYGGFSDTSDETFTITGGGTVPPPSDTNIAELKRRIIALETIVQNLTQEIAAMKTIIMSL